MVSATDWVPQRGHIVWIDFNPQAGSEQAGRRPAVVLSPSAYNGRVGLALFCPITRQVKGYPFEVALPPGLSLTGVMSVRPGQKHGLANDGNAAPADSLPAGTVDEVLQRVGLPPGHCSRLEAVYIQDQRLFL